MKRASHSIPAYSRNPAPSPSRSDFAVGVSFLQRKFDKIFELIRVRRYCSLQ